MNLRRAWFSSLVAVGVFASLVISPLPVTSGNGIAELWQTNLAGGRVQEGSPTLADLDGDGKLEIIVGTTKYDGSPVLAVLNYDGSIRWQVTLEDPAHSAPVVVDLDYPPDGRPEILVTTGGDVHQQRGAVIAYSSTGQRLWEYSTLDAQGTGTPSGNFASPVVGDVDGDGDLEIVVGSWDRNIYLLDHRGRYVWHYHVADTVWSTAALADINRDGNLEIIVGTDIKGGGVLLDGYRPTNGGFVLILDKDGRKLARRQMNEAIFSSPAVADVNRDGRLEIFVGTGMYYYKVGAYSQPYVYGFRVETEGSEWQLVDLPGWPRPVAYPSMSSPALADLDGDGSMEVIIGTGYTGVGDRNACTDGETDPNCRGALYAWHHNGQPVSGFPMWPRDYQGKNAFIQSSPVVGDVDGDGSLDILFSMLWDVIAVGADGLQKANLRTGYSVFASPALGDINGNGRVNVVIGSSHIYDSARGRVYAWEFGDSVHVPETQPWPQFHRDEHNTGFVPRPPELRLSTSDVRILKDANEDTQSASARLEIRNAGDGEISWDAKVISFQSPAAVMTALTPSSGVLQDRTTLTIVVDARSLSEGYHQIDIQLDAYCGDVEVIGSPATIRVTLYKGEVVRTFLPSIQR